MKQTNWKKNARNIRIGSFGTVSVAILEKYWTDKRAFWLVDVNYWPSKLTSSCNEWQPNYSRCVLKLKIFNTRSQVLLTFARFSCRNLNDFFVSLFATSLRITSNVIEGHTFRTLLNSLEWLMWEFDWQQVRCSLYVREE